MSLVFSDSFTGLYNGDARNMTEVADESVQCVVTSPPYWGLRNYEGKQQLVWGGDNHHDHIWQEAVLQTNASGGQSDKQLSNRGSRFDSRVTSDLCTVCGAWKGQLGLEPTVQLYVAHIIDVLREIRRVLRSDGICFLNLGDSYAGSGKGMSGDTWYGGPKQQTVKGSIGLPVQDWGNLKPKDLCLVPYRVALAAQDDGWYVRSDIIWEKRDAMPESVHGPRWSRHRIRVNDDGQRVSKGGKLAICPGCPDCDKNGGLYLYKGSWRPTNSHEYIFQLTKRQDYYSDDEAVREPAQDSGMRDRSNFRGGTDDPLLQQHGLADCNHAETGRNIRSVWDIPTQSYSGGRAAHFATFPEDLVERCIKAATPEIGRCPKCGTPWVRVVERHRMNRTELPEDHPLHRPNVYNGPYAELSGRGDAGVTYTQTLGWRAGCKCGIPQDCNIPSTVLDCFAGSGTTLWVAKRLGRRSIGYELSEPYCNLAINRTRQAAMF